MNRPLFGVSGYPKNFLNGKLGKDKENVFYWLNKLNLDVFEFDWTYGINMSDKKCERIKRLSTINNITITLRSPKYINLLTENKKTFNKSLNDLDRSYILAKKLGVNKLVLKIGTKNNVTDKDFVNLSEIFKKYSDINFYIEISKNVNEFGSVEDIMKLNKLSSNVLVYFNLANLHIREGFSLVDEISILNLFNKYLKKYPNIFKDSYFNVYPVSYNLLKKIEVKSFGDTRVGQLSLFESNEEYYPKAGDYIQTILKLNLNPLIVSKSFESEEQGAIILRDKHYIEKMKKS